MIRNIKDIEPVPTSHGVGMKRVLLSSNESGCSLTQIAITELKKDDVAVAHIHPDMQEGFYVLEGEIEVVLDGVHTVCPKGTFVFVDKCTSHEMRPRVDSRIMTIGCVIEASRNKLYPMLFKQNKKTLVWGTEDWTVSAVPNSESEVENGTWARYNLTEVIRRRPAEILGKQTAEKYNNELPLLTKIIDAHDDLSIQVHPNDEMAWREHRKRGKSEMWYILDAEPGAYLYAGFKEHITPEEFKALIDESTKQGAQSTKYLDESTKQGAQSTKYLDESTKQGAQSTKCDAAIESRSAESGNQLPCPQGGKGSGIGAVLARHEVHKGDVFYLPAGRVHAICGGIRLAEVQQSSDVTYRIFDYNRPGLDGKPRELHTALAAQAIDYTVYPEYKTEHSDELNVANEVLNTPYFSIKVIETTKSFHRNMIKYDSFVIMMNLGSACRIHVRSTHDEVILPADTSCLIPAAIADYDIIPIPTTMRGEQHCEAKVLEAFINNKKSITRTISDFLHLN